MEKSKNSFMDKFRAFLFKDTTFPILVAMAAAAIFAGTHLYMVHGLGLFNEIHQAQMLSEGAKTGDYAAAAGYGAGFLIARVLEGPLVGVMDIGGSLMTGVGVGIPATLLAMGITQPIESFGLALLTGAAIGLIIGFIIILVRKFMPQGLSAGGTGIMMGAGNSAGRYLGPLIIISAIGYSIPTGIGSIVGAAISYKFDKPITGGAIIGAMILGSIFPVM